MLLQSTHSDETKAKMSAAKKGANNLNYGKTARNAQAIYIYSTDKSLIIQFSSAPSGANGAEPPFSSRRSKLVKYLKKHGSKIYQIRGTFSKSLLYYKCPTNFLTRNLYFC
jgi:hypothetical protein